MTDAFNFILNWFWLLVVAMVSVIAAGWWKRAEADRSSDPSLRSIHRRIITWFVILMAAPFLCVGLAQFLGCIHSPLDLLIAGDKSNWFVWGFHAAAVSIGVFIVFYVWFFGGAVELSRFPGLFRITGGANFTLPPYGWRIFSLLILGSQIFGVYLAQTQK